MLAWLLRLVLLGVTAAALAAACFFLTHGMPLAAAVGGMAILGGHALVLAAEFAFLPAANRTDNVPAPTLGQLVRAWYHEVVISTRVFCWDQPFRHEAIGDQLEGGSRGVVLVHGFLCNRGMWNPWLRRLGELDVPCIAVTLEPVFGSIDSYGLIIEAAVSHVESLTASKPLIVAHSMGGLAVRRWLQSQPRAADRLFRVYTVGTPHRGTRMARFGLTRNARQMRHDSEWIGSLPSSGLGELFTCFYGNCDNIVVPASAGTIEGADNRHLGGVAHMAMAFDDRVFCEVARQLGIVAGAGSTPPAAADDRKSS